MRVAEGSLRIIRDRSEFGEIRSGASGSLESSRRALPPTTYWCLFVITPTVTRRSAEELSQGARIPRSLPRGVIYGRHRRSFLVSSLAARSLLLVSLSRPFPPPDSIGRDPDASPPEIPSPRNRPTIDAKVCGCST
jgi:hypothetical protein